LSFIVSAFGYISLLNLLPNMLLALGEELGWRGFLVPELTTWVGFRRASLYSGVIWAAWHLPGILAGAYGAAGTPKAYQLACFTLLAIASAVPFTVAVAFYCWRHQPRLDGRHA
jgi:membrane protease YdiL (CAAX protease family)